MYTRHGPCVPFEILIGAVTQEITRYFLGYNEANQMLHCTAPLVTKINILDDIDLDFGDNFTVAAYLPQEYQVSLLRYL